VSVWNVGTVFWRWRRGVLVGVVVVIWLGVAILLVASGPSGAVERTPAHSSAAAGGHARAGDKGEEEEDNDGGEHHPADPVIPVRERVRAVDARRVVASLIHTVSACPGGGMKHR